MALPVQLSWSNQSPLWMNSVFSSGFDPSAGTLKSVPTAIILTTGFTVLSRSLVKALETLID